MRRYKRLNFGISSAAEVFQVTIQQVIKGIDGARNLSDDITVFGRTQQDHDRNLKRVLTRLRDRNITLNKKKCEFNKESLEFYGFVFSKNGISADPTKVEAIKSAENPKNASEMRSFLGMVNYCSRFIPDFATVCKPLRDLTRKNQSWIWTKQHSNAMKILKDAITDKAVMSYFDPTKRTEIIVDASPVGLGAILSQYDESDNRKIIAYASKTLSPVEQRYSQTEREALAIVWSCEHFNLYLYGQKFKLVTDHKPLELIFGKPNSKPPARIERWALRLQPYDFTVEYKPGKSNPSDYMSRHPIQENQTTCSRASKIAEKYVNFITLVTYRSQ